MIKNLLLILLFLLTISTTFAFISYGSFQPSLDGPNFKISVGNWWELPTLDEVKEKVKEKWDNAVESIPEGSLLDKLGTRADNTGIIDYGDHKDKDKAEIDTNPPQEDTSIPDEDILPGNDVDDQITPEAPFPQYAAEGYTAPRNPFCYINGVQIPDYSNQEVYEDIVYHESLPISFQTTCDNGVIISTTQTLPVKYFHQDELIELPFDVNIEDYYVEFAEDDDMNKAKCNFEGNCIFKENNDSFNINYEVSQRGYDYTLIDNGIEIQKTVIPEVIVLLGHKVKRFRNSQEINNLMETSINLMREMDIVENVSYDEINNKTKINIKLNSINNDNVNLYQILPKSIVSNLSLINVVSDGGGEFFVKDKEPVIGWYFNETKGDEEVKYEIPGNSTGGVIILTQDPILFNEGELVVNYRESNCNADEAFLFEIDSLDASNLFLPNSSKTYKVCVAHVSENLYADNTHAKGLKILDFENGGNLSLTNVLTNQVSISTDDTNIYWSQIIQETNPNGNYSCLGSIDNENSSKFGDCVYNPAKRIWIHLGEDYYSPISEIDTPFLSHNMKVRIIGIDNIGGSGIANITYSIDSQASITKTFTQNLSQEEVSFYETCSNDWGCTKEIKYFSCDVEGNCEDEKLFNLNIIEKGSSCTSECIAKPSPDRYVKECRNLNGCSFYPINNNGENDDGKYVAEKCDLATKGTWVKYSDSKEILCPNGPIRNARFSEDILNIHMSECDQVIKTPYPVIINGEELIMDVVSCFNYN